jgi:ATP-dependent helicase HrpB
VNRPGRAPGLQTGAVAPDPIPPLSPSGLPVEAVESEVDGAVRHGGVLVLVAEPGAGKSTVVPAWVARAVPGRVVVLQPRRLAARAVAGRLAERWGEPVGGLVGLTMRGERRVSARTRVEVVTEAVLTRRLQDDPSLPGTSAVVFDEFHERSLHADLGLALALEARAALRPELVVVVMSATLDAGPVAGLLGGAPTVTVAGRAHPVDTVHLARPRPDSWAREVAAATRRALAETAGDVLVFVPGRAEIDAVRRLVATGPAVEVVGLHGGGGEDHRWVLGGAGPGRRRVVVATAVAQTSITLPGVTAVVDGGRLRQPRYDERTGLGRLETIGVTRFAADQRRGRAGRTGPGRCYRLWPAEEDRHLARSSPPEVLAGDPLPLALELARWGDPDGAGLAWLDPPPVERLARARAALVAMGLVTDDGRLTDDGHRAARLPLHPRLGALVLRGAESGMGALALSCAVVLDEEPGPGPTDLRRRLDVAGTDRTVRRRAADLARRAGVEAGEVDGSDRSGRVEDLAGLLAAAWPDRVARRRPAADGRYGLAGGGEVAVWAEDPLARSEWLVVADAGGLRSPPRLRLGVPIERAEVVRRAGGHLTWHEDVRWDDQDDDVRAERRWQLGSLVLHREPWPDPPAAALAEALLDGVRRRGVAVLGWRDAGRRFQARVAFLRTHGQDLPAVDDTALTERVEEWLAPALGRCRSPADLATVDPGPLVEALLGWEQRRRVDDLAPTELELPDGRPRALQYVGDQARWSARIQDLFGLDRHPTVVGGSVPVVVELLSPAGRPAQVTTDLPGFWRGSYRQVRAELRGRYPKHRWPDEPWRAEPGRTAQR